MNSYPKILGAKIIVLGLLMIALGFIGVHLRLFWFLDTWGPIVAYILKFGVIILGVYIWRNADRDTAVQDDVTDDQSRRAWIPVAVAGLVAVGIIGFIATNVLKDSRLNNQLTREPAPALWAADKPALWPNLTLMQKAKFSHHTALDGGCACLVRLPTGEICALTAGHLLGRAGGVTPGFVRGGLGGLDKDKLATLNSEITSWKLFLPDAEDASLNVAGLYGDAKQLDENCDQVLLSLSPAANDYPVTPLDLRLSIVTTTEELYLLTYSWDDNGDVRQVAHKVHRVPGMIFTCVMDKPAELNGFSGAPIVDKNGLLVGILTGGSMLDMNPTGYMRAFSGHLASELMPVLKEAVAVKGLANLAPIKVVSNKLPVQNETNAPAKSIGNTI